MIHHDTASAQAEGSDLVQGLKLWMWEGERGCVCVGGGWGRGSLASFFKTANSQGQLLITNVRNIAISMAKYLQGSN